MNVMPFGQSFVADHETDPFVAMPAAIEAEQAVVAALMANPSRVHEICARIRPEMFIDPINADIVRIVSELVAEGRTPSLQTLNAIAGDREVADGVTLRHHLGQLLRRQINGMFAPWQDSVDVVKDLATRREWRQIGMDIVAQAFDMGLSIPEVAANVVVNIDDTVAWARERKRLTYDAAGAADLAIEHLDGSSPMYPTTGLADLDHVSGGWPRGQLSIVAGRPGMGKSASCLNFARAAAKAGNATGVFSLEMQGMQVGARLLTDLAYASSGFNVYYEDILKRNTERIDERQRRRLADAREALKQLPLRVEEQRGLSLAEIIARTRKMAMEFDRAGQKLDVLFVDHIGLVRASSRYAGNRNRELAEITDGLATLAKDLEIAVVGLCQLNRGVEGRDNKRPGMSDLRESGAIEEDASLIVFAYRPAYYLMARKEDNADLESARLHALEETKHSLEYIVAKNRNGQVGTVNCFIDIGANAIRNRDFTSR